MTPIKLAVIATILALGAKGADSIEIDALGGAIPNVGSQTEVHITSATGSGNSITLAVDRVTAKALVQKQSEVNAVVSMLREQQLLLGRVAVLSEMSDLTIGDQLGTGVLSGIGSEDIEFGVESVGGRLYINAFFTNTLTKTVKKTGLGSVTANGDFHASVDQNDGAMAFAVATTSDGELPVINISGSGLIYDVDSAGDNQSFGDGEASVSGEKVAVVTATGMVPVRGLNVNGGNTVLLDHADVFLPAAIETVSFDDYDVPDSYVVGSNSVGVLKLSGGSMASRLEIGKNYHGKGALYLDGGAAVTNICSSTNSEYLVGNGGFAHIGITGGSKYVAAGMSAFAYGGQVGVVITNGSFVSAADSLRKSGVMIGGTEGYASLYVGQEGKFDLSAASQGVSMPASSSVGDVVVTVDGGVANLGTTQLKSTRNVVFNFNDGGEIVAGNIGTDSTSGGGAYFQFNGGIFRPSVRGLTLLEGTLWCFEHGAVFNIPGGSSTIAAAYPLERPSGKGLVSIDIPEVIADEVFIAPPVLVVSGDGHGASAICELDAETGKIAGFKVVGHGCDYDYGTAMLYYGNDSYKIGSDYLHFTNNVSGGLTKTGAGTLLLYGKNTYTGNTVIRNGKLQLVGEGAISPLSGLKFYTGGILDLGGSTASFSNYGGDGTGTVTNGIASLDGLIFDMDRVKALDIDTLKFTTNIVFSISAGVKLLNATEQDLDRGRDYVLCNLTGDSIPERLPPLDAETRANLSDPWGILIVKDEAAGTAKAVLHFFGGSYFIYY